MAIPFFIIIVFVGAFFLMNLVLAILKSEYANAAEEHSDDEAESIKDYDD